MDNGSVIMENVESVLMNESKLFQSYVWVSIAGFSSSSNYGSILTDSYILYKYNLQASISENIVQISIILKRNPSKTRNISQINGGTQHCISGSS